MFVRPGGIGDCLLSFPAMQFARGEYTEVWAPSTIVPLLGWADAAASIASTGLDLFGVGDLKPDQRLLERLRGFDSVVSWYGANRDEFRRATEELGLRFQFLTALPDSHQHAVDFFAEQLGAPAGLTPRLKLGDVPKRDSLVIHPFSGSLKKNWPMEKFQALADEAAVPVEWIAGPEEALDGAARFESLWDAARWIAGARLYLGNDSGMTHLAAATGVPVIAIFGPTDPEVWGPRGEHVVIKRWAPIHALPVSEILQEVQRVLARA